jgi:hypothetical protein
MKQGRKPVRKWIGLASLLFLMSCGDNNPLIGKWKSDALLGASSAVEFKSHAMITTSSAFGVDESREQPVSSYQIDKKGDSVNRVGVSVQKGQDTETVWYKILDKDTVQLDAGLVAITYHRVTAP